MLVSLGHSRSRVWNNVHGRVFAHTCVRVCEAGAELKHACQPDEHWHSISVEAAVACQEKKEHV